MRRRSTIAEMCLVLCVASVAARRNDDDGVYVCSTMFEAGPQFICSIHQQCCVCLTPNNTIINSHVSEPNASVRVVNTHLCATYVGVPIPDDRRSVLYVMADM